VVEIVRALNLSAQPWLDGLVLIIEVRQISDQILDDEHVRKRVDLGGLAALVNITEAGECVGTVDVHRATAANTFSAGSAECKSRILLVLDLD